MKKSKYFALTELVCPHVFKRFGEFAWLFLDYRLLETIDILKEKIFPDKKIYVNNWNIGGKCEERGLRCGLCSIVKSKVKAVIAYLSAHVTGKGIDFTVEGISAVEARKIIDKNKVHLPYPIRLEDDESAPTWVHLDVYDNCNSQIITYVKG